MIETDATHALSLMLTIEQERIKDVLYHHKCFAGDIVWSKLQQQYIQKSSNQAISTPKKLFSF